MSDGHGHARVCGCLQFQGRRGSGPGLGGGSITPPWGAGQEVASGGGDVARRIAGSRAYVYGAGYGALRPEFALPCGVHATEI